MYSNEELYTFGQDYINLGILGCLFMIAACQEKTDDFFADSKAFAASLGYNLNNHSNLDRMEMLSDVAKKAHQLSSDAVRKANEVDDG
jgi:hypothetical protein